MWPIALIYCHINITQKYIIQFIPVTQAAAPKTLHTCDKILTTWCIDLNIYTHKDWRWLILNYLVQYYVRAWLKVTRPSVALSMIFISFQEPSRQERLVNNDAATKFFQLRNLIILSEDLITCVPESLRWDFLRWQTKGELAWVEWKLVFRSSNTLHPS